MTTQNKNLFKSSCLIILILAATSVMAQPAANLNNTGALGLIMPGQGSLPTKAFMANLSQEDAAPMKFRIWFANPARAKVTISIHAETGNYAFSKSVSDEWYAQTYDFTGVEDGSYMIEVAKGKDRFRKKILIATDTYTTRKASVY